MMSKGSYLSGIIYNTGNKLDAVLSFSKKPLPPAVMLLVTVAALLFLGANAQQVFILFSKAYNILCSTRRPSIRTKH